MAQQNLISAEISARTLADIIEKISSVQTELQNVLTINLTGQERLELYKLGDKSMAFVDKSLGYASSNLSLVPSYLDLAEATKDLQLFKDLNGIIKLIAPLHRALEDAAMVAGSEAYDASLIFYSSVKAASRVNVPGSEAINEDLQKRFAAKSKKKDQKQA